jgi:hypothetical protein
MDKLQVTGQNLGRVFSSRSDCMSAMNFFCYEAKQLNLKLKTWPKKLLGFLLLAFALPWVGTSKKIYYRATREELEFCQTIKF